MKAVFTILFCITIQAMANADTDMMAHVKSLTTYKCKVDGDGVLGAPDFVSKTKYFSAKSIEEAATLVVNSLGIRNLSDGASIYEMDENQAGAVIIKKFECSPN